MTVKFIPMRSIAFIILLTGVFACSSDTDTGVTGDASDTSDTSDTGVSEHIINGFVLTGIERTDNDGRQFGSSTITYDYEANTSEWITYDLAGAAITREVNYYDGNGRINRADYYDSTGALVYTSDYTILNGLITERRRSDGSQMTAEYNSDGKPILREYKENSEITRSVSFSYDDSGLSASSVSISYLQGTEETYEETTTYTYNQLGQVIGQESGNYSEQLFFDENGNNVRRETTGQSAGVVVYKYEPSPEPIVNIRQRILHFLL